MSQWVIAIEDDVDVQRRPGDLPEEDDRVDGDEPDRDDREARVGTLSLSGNTAGGRY